jgi:hypothetical protein
MKHVIFVAGLALTLSYPVQASNEGPGKGEVKKVCTDKKGKDGKPVLDKEKKPVQECKDIKVRKKLEGTEIPEDKKKK